MSSPNVDLCADYPMGESPGKLSSVASSCGSSTAPQSKEAPRSVKTVTPNKKKTMSLAPPMGFTPSPCGPPAPPPARSEDAYDARNDENKSSVVNTFPPPRHNLGLGGKKVSSHSPAQSIISSASHEDEVWDMDNAANGTSYVSNASSSDMGILPSNLNADDIASIIAVQSMARRWKVNKEASPATSTVSDDDNTDSPIKAQSLLTGRMDVSDVIDTTIADVDLSRLVSGFDDDMNAAAATVKAKQANAEEMATQRRLFVEQAMKRRFADNSDISFDDPTSTSGTGADPTSSVDAVTSTSVISKDTDHQQARRGSTHFGTPESKKSPPEGLNCIDTPDSCPSVPSVGLSRMMDDYNNSNNNNGTSINTSTITTSPSPNKATSTPQGKRSMMHASYCNVSAMSIPEHNAVEHNHLTPTKNFNGMLSMCEEYDSEEDDTGSDVGMSTTTGQASKTNGKKMPSTSVCNQSTDLSAMCDLVMNSPAADDTSFDMCAARAAVQNESVYGPPPPTTTIETPGCRTDEKDTSTYSIRSNMIAHVSASALDMRGVSIFNHSSDNLPKADNAKSDESKNYSYPPTDSSSGSPCGSSMKAGDSYDSYDYDVDKSDDDFIDDESLLMKRRDRRRFWSKLCLIISTPTVIGIIGALIWYAFFAPKGWFNSNAAAPSTGGTTVQDDTSNEGIFDIPMNTISPTAMPSWEMDIDFKPEFKPLSTPSRKPTNSPTKRPTNTVAAPTPKATPLQTSFQGHGTFSFYVIGDVPYTAAEEAIVEHQIRNMDVESVPYLDNEGAQFVVHVGDIMKGGKRADCSKWRYELIEDFYKDYCPVPAFMLPGDNDWYDCPNPNQGWRHWVDSFDGMEVHWDGTASPNYSPIPSKVQRQSVRRENFSFTHGGVLFIGVNTVNREPYDINKNYQERMNNNRDWIRQIVRRHEFNHKPSVADEDSIRAIFFFGHHRQSQFWRSLQDDLEDLKVPMAYFHGNGHSWYAEEPFSDWPNFWISQVDMGGIAPPIRVTIQGTTEVAQQYPPRRLSPYHVMMGPTIHVDRRGGTDKGPYSTSSFD